MKSRANYFAVVALAVCGTLAHQAMAEFASSGNCTVDWNGVFQRIDGFGASSAFLVRTWTSAEADLFFSTNTGIGLSLLRNQIQPPATTNAVAFASTSEIGMKLAQARGARIWSAPCSPPVFCKNATPLTAAVMSEPGTVTPTSFTRANWRDMWSTWKDPGRFHLRHLHSKRA